MQMGPIWVIRKKSVSATPPSNIREPYQTLAQGAAKVRSPPLVTMSAFGPKLPFELNAEWLWNFRKAGIQQNTNKFKGSPTALYTKPSLSYGIHKTSLRKWRLFD
jgi:hypothetical protein